MIVCEGLCAGYSFLGSKLALSSIPIRSKSNLLHDEQPPYNSIERDRGKFGGLGEKEVSRFSMDFGNACH